MSVEGTGAAESPRPKAAKSDRVAQQRDRWVRWIVLAVVLVGVTAIGILHQVGGAPKPVGVDALCPLGGLETLWSLIASGSLIQRVAVSSVILFALMVGAALVFRRVFCGYLCPLGFIQELFGKVGRLFFGGKKLEVPAVLDRPARFLKYAVLAFFTVWTWQAAELIIRPYDPWVAWMHLTSAELFVEFGVGAAVLIVSLAGSLLYDRFFCKYLCPTGAFLGIVSKVAPFAMTRNASSCIDCGKCDKACPVNIKVSTATRVTSAECIACNECANACPVVDTLAVATPAAAKNWTGTKLTPAVALGVTVGLFAVVIAATSVTGSFAWTMKGLEPTHTEGAGEATGEGSGAGEIGTGATAGKVNPDDIRGYMSFKEISEASGIPTAAFTEHFGVPEAEMETPIKDLSSKYGFDVHTDVREFVAKKQGE
ncbi:MAG TPA: 4Fe-4S binding protein [Coriobacteriia bacterium]|nr:4Fe-4S binding protein [Coriobacteriia bacterium]